MWPFSTIKNLKSLLAEVRSDLEITQRYVRELMTKGEEQASKIEYLSNWGKDLDKAMLKAVADLETERMRLVACGVAAMANTRESAAQQRVKKNSPYFCASVGDVHNAVDREMALREKVETYEQALRELSCLGNGERPGNSNGNMIAIRALEKHSSTKNCVKCGCEMIPMHDTDKKLCSNGACGHEVDWKLEEGQRYMYKENVEPFVEDRSKSQDDLEPPRSNLERL
ncbi:hypothetical protein S21ZY_111 [Pseudomonas phage ZY21]|nr:hypothetical protein S21ZY_111 [Pseudomonas phage ZY21]